jgi:hypothetical protein
VTRTQRSDQGLVEAIGHALELTEEALGQVSRIAIEDIRDGLEASNHVEAAERDMRSALRQLVLAERELRSRLARRHGVPGDEDAGGGPAVPLRTRSRADRRPAADADLS